ncbi:MAG TPA: DsbA family protein [Myxococcota bacterium]|nr:DsbA family protein [Myxococcota bacterium]
MIAVCVDFKSPHSYLAFEPTRALERRLGIDFAWWPLVLPALPRPKPASPGDDRGARHRRARAEYLARDIARYAEARGLALGDVHRDVDTTLPAQALLFLRQTASERAGAFCARVFELVWKENANPADTSAIEAALGSASGGFRAYLERDAARELAENARALAEAGVWSVPAYLVDGDVFIGRQHLPMLEWLATGRAGEPPL